MRARDNTSGSGAAEVELVNPMYTSPFAEPPRQSRARSCSSITDWTKGQESTESCFTATRAIVVLILLNDVSGLIGLALVGLTAWELTGFGDTQKFGALSAGSGMGFGALLVVVSFLGCCGAMNRSRKMVKYYVVLTALLVLGECAICVLSALYLPPYYDAWETNSTEISSAAEIAANDKTLRIFDRCCVQHAILGEEDGCKAVLQGNCCNGTEPICEPVQTCEMIDENGDGFDDASASGCLPSAELPTCSCIIEPDKATPTAETDAGICTLLAHFGSVDIGGGGRRPLVGPVASGSCARGDAKLFQEGISLWMRNLETWVMAGAGVVFTLQVVMLAAATVLLFSAEAT